MEIFIKERKDAHLMVEEFMLLANRSVAEYIHQREQVAKFAFIYRVHDRPDNQKLEWICHICCGMGFKMDLSKPAAVSSIHLISLAKKAEEDET
ncbi:MAG: RNB domain-containing ribonuclease [Saprospiraceae bacterium]|nr:RNB domain-containing ribonuclease [Candidatus Parvibacillus calidus]